ncbi:MAG: ABC transporter substrate-binding protein [Phycisphaerales bacterium]|nr:ABC transporter substrate-binding protein [Phycisphaerales bacterium]
MPSKLGVGVLLGGLVLLVVLPVLLGGSHQTPSDDVRTLVIVTPHNEQIRTEFARAFKAWHLKNHGEEVNVAWSVPGGTSEIRALLESQWIASLERGDAPGGFADLVFGGGSYEHGRLKDGVRVAVRDVSHAQALEHLGGFMGKDKAPTLLADAPSTTQVGHVLIEVEPDGEAFDLLLTSSISVPAEIDLGELDERYGRSSIGGVSLWDPQGYWFGTALSSFGLIANLDECARLGIDVPRGWASLGDPRLQGMVSLVNPAQSGSVTTAFETLLGHLGWERGWQVLRRAAANARTISASSLRGPMDVAAGDAALGVCIDFFGRAESQALADHGAPDRIRYVDPDGETTIDPDPISMLADPPDEELAGRFIAFTLSDVGQALWQLPPADSGPGPRQFALRRIPITDSAWERYGDAFIDRDARPGEISPPAHAHRANRAFIAPLLSAMALDERSGLEAAWEAIVTHPAYPQSADIVTGADVEDPELRAMLEAFDAMPTIATPDGEVSLDTPEGRSLIKAGWLREGWRDDNLWHEQQRGTDALRQEAGRFFRSQYRQVREGSDT